jgi:hypothetical protein
MNAAGETRSKKRFAGFAALGSPWKKKSEILFNSSDG